MARRKPPVKVKICGMTSQADAMMAAEFGADAVGFIFYRKSPRYVSEKTVKNIVLPPFVNRVGVFVNEDADRINRIADSCQLDLIQLHGDESPAFCKKIKRKVIKAVRLRDAKSIERMAKYDVEGFLLDAYEENIPGGTGKTCDWSLVRRAKKFGPIILAGGLKPSNVEDAIRKVQPYGVDVCSGVEKVPGKKDRSKVRDFIQAARNSVL